MGIRFACHVCNKKLNIKRELAGRRGVCPSCSSRFRIPLEDTEVSTPVEAVRKITIESDLVPSDTGHGEMVVTDHDPTVRAPVTAGVSGNAGGLPTDGLPAHRSPTDGSPTDGSLDGGGGKIFDEDSEATWYVRPASGGQYGPATGEVLRQWIAEGRVGSTALLWRDGWPQWRDAEKVLPDLAGQLPSSPTPAEASPDSIRTEVVPTSPSSAGMGDRRTTSSEGANAARTKPKSKQRTQLISALVAVAIVLIGVLVVVMSRG